MPGGRASDDLLLLAVINRRLRRQRHPRGKKRRLVLVVLAIVLLGAGAVGATAFGGQALVNSSCSLSQLKPETLSDNSFVYAHDGTLLGSIPAVENRQWLTLRQTSRWLPAATIAIEDRRFYEHGALDYQGILRAAWDDLTSLSLNQGGSTITQQLVRTLYLGGEQRTLSRKLKEACLALRLERDWTKHRILTAYLNDVYYGHHAIGVEAAAQTYFSRRAMSLTLPQAALIAGLPQAPSSFDPLERPDLALARRNEVLAAMLADRAIDLPAYRWAIRTPLGLKPGGLYSQIKEPPFFSYVEDQLVAKLGATRVQRGGLRVTTTLVPRLQRLGGIAIRNVLKSKNDPAAALVAIDPGSGAIRAMVSYVPSGQKLQFNLATQARRQAGSAFKPFVLATALAQGISPYSHWSGPPELVLEDPKCYYRGKPWDVHNYADESAGSMNLLDATAHSVNTIYAQVSDTVGPDNVVATARRLGITSPLLPVCSITLGTEGVAPLEMADAYATFAARGLHHPPEAIQRVGTATGQTLTALHWNGKRVMPQNDADMVTYALQRVLQYGTGTAAYFGRPAAGKTGTAENYEDAWFCGYVPQLATCVWIGYPHRELSLLNVEGVAEVFGGSLPAAIWHAFMAEAVGNLEVRDFPEPSFSPYDQYPDAPATTTSTSSYQSG
jgi:penicillin-binding protein 1A